jgi:hypothetical protein
MKRKNIYLSLALVLPVLVFVFLKFFGRNQFEIPVYHVDKLEIPNGCDIKYDVPYLVADSTLVSLGSNARRPSLILFNAISSENSVRLAEEMNPNKLQVVSLDDSVKSNEQFLSCVFLLPDKFNAVLVDVQRRIRGYYQIESREEMDRLLVELKILFNEY